MTANLPPIDAMTRFRMEYDEYDARRAAELLIRRTIPRIVNCGGCGCGEYNCEGCYCQCDYPNCWAQHAPVSESESEGSEETEEEEEDHSEGEEEEDEEDEESEDEAWLGFPPSSRSMMAIDCHGCGCGNPRCGSCY